MAAVNLTNYFELIPYNPIDNNRFSCECDYIKICVSKEFEEALTGSWQVAQDHTIRYDHWDKKARCQVTVRLRCQLRCQVMKISRYENSRFYQF
mgnify:CR=1 FL=1